MRRLASALLFIVAVQTCGADSTGHPEWSPDGRLILFESDMHGNPDIFVMDAEGGNVVNLSNHSAVELHPSWSVDGKWVYFDSNRTGDFDSYRMRIDGSELETMVRSGSVDLILRESEQGLIYNSMADGDWEIYWLKPGTTNAIKLTDNRATDIVRDWGNAPGWFVFDSDRDTDGKRQLYHLDLNTGERIRLTHDDFDNRFARRGPPGSPWISFTSNRSGTRGLWLIHYRTGEIRRFYDGEFDEGFANWSPDGSTVLFEVKSDAERFIMQMDVASGDTERLIIQSAGAIEHR